MKALSNNEYEKLFLDRWSHVVKKDKKSTRDLFSCDNFILHVHGCIQQEMVFIYINPSCKYNFININLAETLQVPIKNIQIT
jgi:hypothetical protein